MTYFIATIWVEGNRIAGDYLVYREIVRLVASSESDFRTSVEALMANRTGATAGREITLTFGPISIAKNQSARASIAL